MWKVSWLYEKVHDFLVVPLYYIGSRSLWVPVSLSSINDTTIAVRLFSSCCTKSSLSNPMISAS